MAKKVSIKGKQKTPEAVFARIKQAISEDCACYILITCSKPSEDGKMDVELEFDGDEDLASFLIENAGQVFEERLRETK
jgi:hypothetical protein